MQIVVNKETKTVQSTGLADILSELGLGDKRGIAVALNARVIARTHWNETILQEGDSLTIIRATQGG